MKIKRLLAATLVIGIIAVMTGCNTAKGVKDDVEEGADKVEEGVDDATGKDENDVKIDVTLSVEAKDIVGSEYESTFNEDMLVDEGTILSQSKYTVDEGTTVQELVRKALDESKIEYNINGTGADTILEDVRGIKGGMAGETSGWVYSVNGENIKDAMNTYKLKDGDDVKVYYKLDMGTDITPNNDNGSTTGEMDENNNKKQ